jgi:hypothetical protein
LNEILISNTKELDIEEPEITPYDPAASYYADEDDLLEPVDDVVEQRSSDPNPPPIQLSKEMKVIRGQRLGNYICRFCDKTFRYIKAFNTHIKQHKKGEICKSGNKRRYVLKKKKVVPEVELDEDSDEHMKEEEEQAPYDSLSPYGSPAHFEQPAREDSPDMGMMMLNNFHNGDNGSSEFGKKLRMRKQRLKARESPEIEMVEEKPAPTPSTSSGSRGRGRPRKDQVAKPEEPPEEASPFADFCEVDVSRMLKKNIFDNDSFSQSATSTGFSRSRSASVELIDDVDIFGCVLPDNGNTSLKAKQPGKPGMTFSCTEAGCKARFHLRANLKKHLRETHGSI